MQLDREARLKRRPPSQFKKQGRKVLPAAVAELERLGWTEKELMEKWNPDHGAYRVEEDGELTGKFHLRWNQSGLQVIHYRKELEKS